MNNYKVILSSNKNYISKLKTESDYKVLATSGGIQVPARFEDLVNFNYDDKNDKYVIMYDSATQEYKLVNPDEILSASITDPISPGLPNEVINELESDLDNKIDLDAGGW
jgi:hypothetical protein